MPTDGRFVGLGDPPGRNTGLDAAEKAQDSLLSLSDLAGYGELCEVAHDFPSTSASNATVSCRWRHSSDCLEPPGGVLCILLTVCIPAWRRLMRDQE
jgi:hypothetical protein